MWSFGPSVKECVLRDTYQIRWFLNDSNFIEVP